MVVNHKAFKDYALKQLKAHPRISVNKLIMDARKLKISYRRKVMLQDIGKYINKAKIFDKRFNPKSSKRIPKNVLNALKSTTMPSTHMIVSVIPTFCCYLKSISFGMDKKPENPCTIAGVEGVSTKFDEPFNIALDYQPKSFLDSYRGIQDIIIDNYENMMMEHNCELLDFKIVKMSIPDDSTTRVLNKMQEINLQHILDLKDD